ncbi:hypothetical protein FQN54_006855 [Arachnomyces sp. PD_36]|nr:hypothetical protein FQN54_006855 [Arachnomyces sp. PD_36]
MLDDTNQTSIQEQQLIDGVTTIECASTEDEFSHPEHLRVSVHHAFTLEQSNPRTLYFAFGSNLSYTQMRKRCTSDPEISAKPVGIARLDNWRWIICGRGYANVLPPSVNGCDGTDGTANSQSDEDDKDVVWGVLYDMTPEDLRTLDMYEGIDRSAPKTSPDHPCDSISRPYEQGNGDYNKWNVLVTVTKWLDEDHRKKYHGYSNTITGADGTVGFVGGDHAQQRVLVYVDEHHTEEGPPKEEYIVRMNRAIRESVELGIPKDWIDKVMRRSIPEES